MMLIAALALFSAAAPLPPAALQGERELSAGDLRRSGTVRLDVTCKPEVKEDFQTALALLHSFFYDEARRRFLDVAARDPECAMAWWGVAMTYYHPLWAPPTPKEMEQGIAAVEKAKTSGGRTDLERGFIEAIDAYYRTFDKSAASGDKPAASGDKPAASGPVEQSCHGPRAHGARALAYLEVMEGLREKHPDNLEVKVFHTLALLGTAPASDMTYANQELAMAILGPLFEEHPDHPGIAHYIIHAMDYPSLASRGLAAARRYSDVAPWVPHALHMPSHIYTRLGMWEDSIEANRASSAAARDYGAKSLGGKTYFEDLHALDYLVFAYLQTGQDRNAGEIVEHVREIREFHEDGAFAAAYAVGAIPARYALERRSWKEAAALPVLHPKLVESFPFALAHTEFARGLGAARSGDVETARKAVDRLAVLKEGLKEPKWQWWIDQVEIQRLAAAGWLARAEGNDGEAERLLRASAEVEGKAGTHPVTPGQILPAREQLGDLLMELGRSAEALVQYEQSLEAFPNRLNGHFGAGRAAELSGQAALARSHYEHVVGMTKEGDGSRGELRLAKEYLSSN
jgi:tetratricopeptide (TPR) repeat protein